MIKEYFLKLSYHWKILLKDRAYRWSLLVGGLVFVGAFVVMYFMSAYNDNVAYAPVGDFILDSVGTYNLEFLFVWGFYFLVVSTFVYSVFVRPELAPFMLKTYGILMLVRSCFIVLTHVGPPAGFFYEGNVGDVVSMPLSDLFFRNDLFFSGHTSIPFLAFLLLKDAKYFRWVMFAGSLIMGATVLLMHVHYSIDVFAAFFITHGIYVLSDRIFNDLNVRFKRRIRLYGWNALQKRIRSLRDRKKRSLKGDSVGIPELEKVE